MDFTPDERLAAGVDGLLDGLLRLALLAVTVASACAPPDSVFHGLLIPQRMGSLALSRQQATQHAVSHLFPLPLRCRRPLHPGCRDFPATEDELLRPAVRGVVAGVFAVAVAVSSAGGRLRRCLRAKPRLLADLSRSN